MISLFGHLPYCQSCLSMAARIMPGAVARACSAGWFILLVGFSGALIVVSILDSLWLPFGAAFAVLGGGRLLVVPVGTMGLCWPGDSPFRIVVGLMGCVCGWRLGKSMPCLPRLILLVSFSDTLLVVSILDIVYDCHFGPLLWSWRD